MQVDKRTLRDLVREVMSEIDESELITKRDDGRTWEELSSELKMEVDTMINNISQSKYTEALNNISEISATMKMWKHRIVMGGMKDKKSGEEYNLGKFSF